MLNFFRRRREQAEARRRHAIEQADRNRRAAEEARRRRYNQHLTQSLIDQPRPQIDDDDTLPALVLASAMMADDQPTISVPVETFTAGGGDFGGAGASASWDPPASDSSPSSCGVDSSSSSDSSSWSSSCDSSSSSYDSGSSSSYDSGSSSYDSGSSSSFD